MRTGNVHETKRTLHSMDKQSVVKIGFFDSNDEKQQIFLVQLGVRKERIFLGRCENIRVVQNAVSNANLVAIGCCLKVMQ